MNITHPNQLIENGTFKAGILSALKCYLFTETVVEEMRPKHDAISKAALELFKPVVEDREAYRNSKRLNNSVGKSIDDYERLYYASDEAVKPIWAYYASEMEKLGYKAEGDFCPWLTAKSTHCQAERQLIDVMEIHTKFSNVNLHIKGKRDEYLKIILGMLIGLANVHNIELNIIKEALIA
jgi:hypothetical protein